MYEEDNKKHISNTNMNRNHSTNIKKKTDVFDFYSNSRDECTNTS